MLSDALGDESCKKAADGVLLCKFPVGQYIKQYEVHEKSAKKHVPFELFFCCKGSFLIQCENGANEQISSGDIVLVSNELNRFSLIVQKSVMGYSVVDTLECESLLQKIYHSINFTMQWDISIRKLLNAHKGCFPIKHVFWKQDAFWALKNLPEWEQPTYCILKAAELFYLLNAQCSASKGKAFVPQECDDSFFCIGTYIENHLDEKLTISLLCRRFNLSPTTLKNRFREIYGQPIHKWILNCRLQRAAELLQLTDMKVIQVAQSVGYESAGQFNVIFRRVYGATPNQYRKNVRCNKKMADSV